MARYDLNILIAGFDFYHWLVVVREMGAEKIVFGIDHPKETKWNRNVVMKRFHSIIEPGPAMAGLKYEIGSGGQNLQVSPYMGEFVKFCKTNRNRFKRLVAVNNHLEEKVRYTITLRNTSRYPEKNSNVPAWTKFANEIGAKIIKDFDDEPISLVDRMNLYANAEMNFGVMNGPLHLLTLTEYPVVMFKADLGAAPLEKCGVPNNSQLPWAYENQKIVWEDDSYENIVDWWSSNS